MKNVAPMIMVAILSFVSVSASAAPFTAMEEKTKNLIDLPLEVTKALEFATRTGVDTSKLQQARKELMEKVRNLYSQSQVCINLRRGSDMSCWIDIEDQITAAHTDRGKLKAIADTILQKKTLPACK